MKTIPLKYKVMHGSHRSSAECFLDKHSKTWYRNSFYLCMCISADEFDGYSGFFVKVMRQAYFTSR